MVTFTCYKNHEESLRERIREFNNIQRMLNLNMRKNERFEGVFIGVLDFFFLKTLKTNYYLAIRMGKSFFSYFL